MTLICLTLIGVALTACGLGSSGGASTDAQLMVRALDADAPLAQALAGCEEISDMNTRGDCLSAAVSSHEKGALSDCEAIEDTRWRSECIFRLAESTRKEDLPQAIALCGATDYDRQCWGHLIRDEAGERVELSPAEQAEFAHRLTQSLPREESSELYWEEWAIARFRGDLLVQREDCGGLKKPRACVQGLRRARKRLEAELGSENRCEAYRTGRAELVLSDGRVVLNSGVPGGPELVTLCAQQPG